LNGSPIYSRQGTQGSLRLSNRCSRRLVVKDAVDQPTPNSSNLFIQSLSLSLHGKACATRADEFLDSLAPRRWQLEAYEQPAQLVFGMFRAATEDTV